MSCDRVAKRWTRVAMRRERKTCAWLFWTWISLSCRHQSQDLTVGLGLVNIFTNTQVNSIGPFDWQYRGDGGDICHCTTQQEIFCWTTRDGRTFGNYSDRAHCHLSHGTQQQLYDSPETKENLVEFTTVYSEPYVSNFLGLSFLTPRLLEATAIARSSGSMFLF